jgi:hypothetical protein
MYQRRESGRGEGGMEGRRDLKLLNIFSKTGLPSLAIKKKKNEKKKKEKNRTENLLGRKYFHKMIYLNTMIHFVNVFLSFLSQIS